jgi:signal transduction histidine kinase/ligand-binding sensor domain-containing protein
MRFLLLLGALLLAPVSVFAQSQAVAPLRFERYTIDQGLASDRVRSITQDKLGYIWMATDGGVSRYDGYTFHNYRNFPNKPGSLSENFVHVVFTDSQGLVWVGTRDGLNLYLPASDQFKRFYHVSDDPSSVPHSSVHSIYESPTGQLWFGTENGLAEYDRENGGFITRAEGLRGSTVTSIDSDAEGRLWIGTNNRGVVTFHPSDNAIRFLNEDASIGIDFPSVNISKIMVDSNGDCWIGFLQDSGFFSSLEVQLQYGLVRYNPKTQAYRLYSYNPAKGIDLWYRISDILEDSEKTIWVTTYLGSAQTGLHRYNRESDTFTRYTHDPNNPSSMSWSFGMAVFEDRNRNLWVGTSRGVNKADLGRWQMGLMSVDPTKPMDLINNFYGMEEVEQDVFWIGTDGLGVITWDRNTSAVERLEVGHPAVPWGNIHVIQKDPSNEIWLGSAGRGLIRYNRTTNTRKAYQTLENESGSLVGNYVTDLLLTRDSTLWVATSSGLSRYNRRTDNFTSFRKATHPSWMTGDALSVLMEDRNGNLWIGTNRHVYDPIARNASGLIRWNPKTNEFKTFHNVADTPGTLSNDAIYSIAEDPKGDIWVATNNGLNRYLVDEDRFEVFLEADGLPSPNIVGLVFDNAGILWISTLKGIARMDIDTGAIRVFNKSDNVQGNRFNTISFLKSSRGEVMFGGVAGLNYFDPAKISGRDVIPQVWITGITVNDTIVRFDKPLHEMGSITLSWSENSVGFDFLAVNFRSTELTTYEFMLEGFDADWVQAGKRRYTNYTNLSPGTYTFKVRARNADGIWSETEASIVINVLPPWWRTYWAYGFYVLLIGFAGVQVDRFQRKRLLAIERERTREKELLQAKEIEAAYTELKATQAQLIQSEKMASLGELTAGIAHEIQNPLNFVNNFSDVSQELVDEMNEELDKGDLEEAKSLSLSIKENLSKINHHGKRADSIVKGMLAHSRSSTGERVPTDINALADEYLRLSYHGLRAKDSSFSAEYRTDFDPTLETLLIAPQEIGRVLLNLINNAFQAKKGSEMVTVTVSTRKEANSVRIAVSDNGTGIPDAVKDKIFQPFFTTKPTGQGTGLGLSLSYDIVKAHGGELTVETKVGEGSTFVITLPYTITS